MVEIGQPQPLPEVDTEIGVDLGLNSYAVDSQGRVLANPRFLRKRERRLRRAQKGLSRKEKGSRNRAKARANALARTKLAKSVHDAAWGVFRRMLEEKAVRYGRIVHVIGRFEPTSQTCSACGDRDGPKPLHIRTWICRSCGTVHDRDINAAKNILAAGRAERLNACGAQVKTRQQPGTAR